MSGHGAVAVRVGDTALGEGTLTVDRLAGLDIAEFIANFRKPRRPVILTDAASAWPLYGKATPDYFRREYGDRVVHVRGQDYKLRALMDLLEASSVERPAPYPCKFEIDKDFRELADGVVPRFGHSLPDRQASRL
ncbi:MAG: cupin-like domain-containing protein, partial [Rhodanobacter sp.]